MQNQNVALLNAAKHWNFVAGGKKENVIDRNRLGAIELAGRVSTKGCKF